MTVRRMLLQVIFIGIMVTLFQPNSCSEYKDVVDYPDRNKEKDVNNDYGIVAPEIMTHLAVLDKEYERVMQKYTLALWDYKTDMTEESFHKLEIVKKELRDVRVNSRKTVLAFNVSTTSNLFMQQKIHLYSYIGEDALPDSKYEKYHSSLTQMTQCIKDARVKHHLNDSRLLNAKEVNAIMKTIDDCRLLKYYWVSYHNSFGQKSREAFKDVVSLIRESANIHKSHNTADYYFRGFESTNIEPTLKVVFLRTRNLYWELHAYVRLQLQKKYSDLVVHKNNHIPCALLGDLWGSSWVQLYESTKPFPEVEDFNITRMMLMQGYSVRRMAKMVQNYFVSLSMKSLQHSFWRNSVFRKKKRKIVDCIPTSWDFYTRDDYRLTMCGKVNEETLDNMYHEMGHLQYMLYYSGQDGIAKAAPNAAFHEAVAMLPGLSTKNPIFFYKMMYTKDKVSEKQLINYLYKLALDKIVMIPFAYSLEMYRLHVLNGSIKPEEYNVKYWKFRRYYTGVGPSDYRSEATFDIGGLLDFANNVPYVHRLVATVLSFQFHQSLCKKTSAYIKSGHPADFDYALCVLFAEKRAGSALKKMLKMGASMSWYETLYVLTSEGLIEPYGLLNYFKRLYEFLKETNYRNRDRLGWI